MAYDYSSESKLFELPNPYRLQNRLLWLCAALLAVAGILSLVWARDAMAGASFGAAAAPLLAGLLMLGAGVACAATAARRLRFFFGRDRPRDLAPPIAIGATGNSKRADVYKEMLRHGALKYPEPQGAVEGLLYHWAPTLITAPLVVQDLAQRHVFNLAAIVATLASYLVSFVLFGNEQTRPWIGALYFLFGAFWLVRPILAGSYARLSSASLVGLVAAAILAPVAIGLVAGKLPALRGFSVSTQAWVMLLAALVACGLAVAAVLAQVDQLPQTRTSVEQARLSMNAPPASLMDELDRTLQAEWTERIPNRRYAFIDPEVQAATPSGSFAGELMEETQPLPSTGTQALGFGAALAQARHRALLLLDLYATALTVGAVGFGLAFVHGFDAAAVGEPGRYTLFGTAVILALVAAFCFKAAAGLWGRFDFSSVLVWVEMVGTFQTSRIGTGNNFTSRLNTENDVVRTESMTLRVWRARIESVVFGKDAERQVTAMFSTEPETKALAAHLAQFARGQSVFVSPTSPQDEARIAALNRGEQALVGEAMPAAQLAATMGLAQAVANNAGTPAPRRFCTQCGTAAGPEAKFCSNCAAPLGA